MLTIINLVLTINDLIWIHKWDKQYKAGLLKDPHNKLTDYVYHYVYKSDRLHRMYRYKYYIGIVVWWTSVFWAPFIIGILAEIYSCSSISFTPSFSYLIAKGFASLCLFSFTTPVTLPIAIIWGLVVHPYFLKLIYFSGECEFYDWYIKELGVHEKQNTAAAVSGYSISKILDKKEN